MTTKKLNKLTMALAVENICDDNDPQLSTVPAFQAAYTDLRTRISNIQVLAQNQVQNVSGIALDKQQARLAMCNVGLTTACAAHAYAIKTKNNTLAKEMDFSISDLMAGAAEKSAERCQNIYDAAHANVANLADYGITAAKLTLLQASIATFRLLISKPRDARIAGKTVTGNLETEFDGLDEDLTVMDDLIAQFAPANQLFVDGYHNARTIVDTSASHAVTNQPASAPQAKTATVSK